jgi:hypothetical protein
VYLCSIPAVGAGVVKATPNTTWLRPTSVTVIKREPLTRLGQPVLMETIHLIIAFSSAKIDADVSHRLILPPNK